MNHSQNNIDSSLLFSQDFVAWFKTELPATWLNKDYVRYVQNWGNYELKLDLDAAYRAYFPNLKYTGVLEQSDPDFHDVGTLIELAYGELILPEWRSAFARLVNEKLVAFNAPLEFVDGHFQNLAQAGAPSSSANYVTKSHKIAAALFVVILFLAVLRGC